MEKHDFDPVQTRTYVMNNRHNHITAAYYLFQKKIEKEPKVKPEPSEPSTEKGKKQRDREESPLIYRPDKKAEYYIPQNTKKVREQKDTSKNDSINASNIISSLVEANKGKLVNQRFVRKPQNTNGNFEKLEDFKNFPQKLNTSVHESDPSKKGALTNRSISGGEDLSF